VALAGGVPKQEHYDVIALPCRATAPGTPAPQSLDERGGELGGLSQQMVSYVERGMRNPTLDTLLRMSAAMKLELADVIAVAVRNARKH